uniref:Chaperone NapD n=1 Tax=Candidatus Kentrum sp. TUN TaxID=2126343 RepID=A0A450ZMZ6_9GAMM|nr:MAG: periplasmic nitrate reductase chaperone NapD [Candidatus Kentron sp. TUN]VFK61226.1 MAG: periplasmic nitrate reductase chaperone NapD [Candidatus Kentron sp. TUN]VFK62401.1 MAG: periplasmic nitrate reductase chaperone NapD [Candidatus Kentron sp. TUN]
MDLCSILLHARPDNLSSVRNTLRALEGVEIHATTPDGRMVITVEGNNQEQFSRTVLQLQDIDGVIDASLVYHFHEEDLEEDG